MHFFLSHPSIIILLFMVAAIIGAAIAFAVQSRKLAKDSESPKVEITEVSDGD